MFRLRQHSIIFSNTILNLLGSEGDPDSTPSSDEKLLLMVQSKREDMNDALGIGDDAGSEDTEEEPAPADGTRRKRSARRLARAITQPQPMSATDVSTG